MTDLTLRPLAGDNELRTSSAVFRRALHRPRATDEEWERAAPSYEPGRTLGAFQGGELIGTTCSYTSRLAVPGGAVLPMAMVSRVGVRADRTRRGALTALMREQLRQAAATGEVIATLRASEARIYGRFGYGVATRGQTCTVTSPARLRPLPPATGEIRLVEPDDAARLLPQVYRRIGLHRPGMIDRPDFWWNLVLNRPSGPPQSVAVHRGPDGDDGFLVYSTQHSDDGFRPTLHVEDLHGADLATVLALWRFVAGIDLVREITGALRPLDEPVEWLFTDRRDHRPGGPEDETWLRVLDVPAALAARDYRAAEPVVLEVTDPLLPANSGRYRIGPDGVTRTDGPPGLSVDVAALGALYLGDVRPSTLAAVDQLTVHHPVALTAADALFGTDDIPWCGTFF